ncbi:hypothetical protein K1719_035686 [Acacia pycnantha]|nr:hypothetical protein K1719_035686 [Acacia pycnantha]
MFELLFGLKLSPPLLLKLEQIVDSKCEICEIQALIPPIQDLGLIAFSALVFGLVDRKCQYCRKAIRFKSGRFERTILKKSLH